MPAPPPGSFSFQANLTSMTDSQLSQTINQLSTAANQHYSTFRPAPATFEPKQWTVTPQATRSSQRSRNRPSRTATSTPVPNQSTPVHQPPQPQQQYVAPVQPPTIAAPPPPPPAHNHPRAPLPTRPQALTTTYPSRMRTGVTLLMQPILASSSTTGGTGRVGTRRGGVINYAEPGSGDELDAGALDSDDSDFVASGGTRSAIRATRSTRVSGGGPFQHYSFQSHQGSPAPFGKQELDQSYLGMIPPTKYIVAKRAEPTRHNYPSQEALENQAVRPTALVPVRVEFETETHRIRDCFVWDLNDYLTRPEDFARIFCADLELPLNPWVDTIANQIRAQLEEHEGLATMDLGSGMDGYASEDTEPEVQEVPECRVILSIDVQIATYHLLDHIEWDLLSPLTPETFAKNLCADIGLTGEAVPLIAHAIHEEIIKHKKDAIEWGVIGGDTKEQVVEDAAAEKEKRDKSGLSLHKDKTGLGLGPGAWGRAPRDGLGRGPRALKSIWKDWTDAEEYATRFEVLTAEEVERREIERERASRRLRRETSKFQFSSARSRRR